MSIKSTFAFGLNYVPYILSIGIISKSSFSVKFFPNYVKQG